MKILLLCNYDPYNAAMVTDSINAFYRYSKHKVVIFSHLVSHGGDLPKDIDLNLFDAVILHYSIFLAIDAYVSVQTRYKLKAFKGVKAIFLQDEYRFVDQSVTCIHDIGIDIIFTCIPENLINTIYPSDRLPGVQRINVLTGYVSHDLIHYVPLPLEKRKYHVSYRGRIYPSWHGRLGREKWEIAKRFNDDAKKYKLKTNISCKEKDRVYGAKWISLIQNSCAVLGVESGASVIDFSGDISLKSESLDILLNKKTRDDLTDIENGNDLKYLDNEFPMNQISPRILEAIALRSLCILYEGKYSGILEPWRHYVPLKKDHSNMEEVVAILQDHERMAEIITNAYSEIACNSKYSYKNFILMVEKLLEDRLVTKGKAPEDPLYSQGTEDEVDAKLDEIRANHPFYFVKNPHSLVVKKGLLYTLAKALYKKLINRKGSFFFGSILNR